MDAVGENVTLLLGRAAAGDAAAAQAVFRSVYAELRQLAGAAMRRERDGHLLQPTALVSEAYLRLVQGSPQWENRRHFFGAAARAMRQVLVDESRRRDAEKRGGDVQHVTLGALDGEGQAAQSDIVRLDELLRQLEALSPRYGRLVELRHFAGLGVEECADLLEVSPATVKRDWAFVRAWLRERLDGP